MESRRSRPRRKDGPPPRCQRDGHGSSDVRFNGFYGTDSRKRQRYLCRPRNGDGEHTFTDVLPRQTTESGDCEACDRHLAPHEGPQAPRLYSFTARDVVKVLVRVAGGQSFRKASAAIRQATGRAPLTGLTQLQLRRLLNGQLAADWVEVFGPVLFEAYRQELVEEFELLTRGEGTLVIDDTTIKYKSGSGRQGGRIAYRILAAVSTTKNGTRVQALRAFPANVALGDAWIQFLRSLPGEATRVVCDDAPVIRSSVKRVWSRAEIYNCEWHRKRNLRKRMETAGAFGANVHGSRIQAQAIEKIKRLVDEAFVTQEGWEEVFDETRDIPESTFRNFVRREDPEARDHIRRRPTQEEIKAGFPVTTGAVEGKIANLRHGHLERRAQNFTNLDRLNRLLQIMQLDLDGRATEAGFLRAVRQFLETHEGRPPGNIGTFA